MRRIWKINGLKGIGELGSRHLLLVISPNMFPDGTESMGERNKVSEILIFSNITHGTQSYYSHRNSFSAIEFDEDEWKMIKSSYCVIISYRIHFITPYNKSY